MSFEKIVFLHHIPQQRYRDMSSLLVVAIKIFHIKDRWIGAVYRVIHGGPGVASLPLLPGVVGSIPVQSIWVALHCWPGPYYLRCSRRTLIIIHLEDTFFSLDPRGFYAIISNSSLRIINNSLLRKTFNALLKNKYTLIFFHTNFILRSWNGTENIYVIHCMLSLLNVFLLNIFSVILIKSVFFLF